MKMRPPATPIITIDPYFSIWSEESILKNPVHWTGKPNTMCGRVFVDGIEYHFMGNKTWWERNIHDMRLENTEIDAFSTIFTYSNDNIRLTVNFTSPMLVDDLYYSSRPIAYCNISYISIDDKEHAVKVKFVVSEELVLNGRRASIPLAHPVNIQGLTSVKMGNGRQYLLNKADDEICIDWGYLYVGVKGDGIIDHLIYDDMYAISIESEINNSALFLFGYDDVVSIQYFGENLKAYWKKDGKTMEDAMLEAANEYETLLERCNTFSKKLEKEATEKGNEKYAEMLLLSLRQIMAGHKLVVDGNGNNLYISKECSSNGCAATVDIAYPSAPLFLLYNTELLKAMLRPVMDYAAKDEWIYDFAPHDVGRYPLVNGQFYGVNRANGKVDIDYNQQMPVEECGNMIILFAAICDADNDVSFVKPYLGTIEKWNKYLLEYGLDPMNQLCTDDFAGHLAHNVNLSIKAIMGIVGYSRILERLGEKEKSDEMMKKAREYANSVLERAQNSDGSYRLAFDKPETFSLKYNSVWDKIWGTNIFPEKFYKGEVERYKKEMLAYGVPLDSREVYTKSDWLLWVSSIAEKSDFDLFTGILWKAYNTMRSRVPMTDWYYCDTSHMTEIKFRHRTVQGGLFIKLLFK